MKKALLFILLTASLSSCSVQTSFSGLSPAEKDMLLTVEDLNSLGLGFSAYSAQAECSAAALTIPYADIAFSRTYEYELNHRNAQAPGESLFLFNTISKGPGPDFGFRNFFHRKIVETVLEFNGITMREPDGFAKLTPDYRFFFLEKNGSPVGNYVCFIAGGASCTVMLSGVYFKDPALWEDLYRKKVQAIISCLKD